MSCKVHGFPKSREASDVRNTMSCLGVPKGVFLYIFAWGGGGCYIFWGGRGLRHISRMAGFQFSALKGG